MASFVLYYLRCLRTEEGETPPSPGDEVRLEIRADDQTQTHKRRMRSGATWDLNIRLEVQNRVEITLWEEDNPRFGDPHDLIGRVQIPHYWTSGRLSLAGHGASYEIEWGPPRG